MDESFGARLRHQREKKGVSLRTIANQTKIKLSLLEGLERDDIRYWPAGIFRRAFVRDYAQAIGLDPDAVVREFVERYPAPIEVPEPPPVPPSRFRSLVESALGSFRPVSHPASQSAAGGGPWFGPAAPHESAGIAATRSSAGADEPAARVESTAGQERLDEPPFTITADLSQMIAKQAKPAAAPRGGKRGSSGGDRAQDGHAPDLLVAARICTELGRVEHTRQVPPLLREAAGLLGAKGLIVWVWDALSQELKPALALGYPSRVLSQLG